VGNDEEGGATMRRSLIAALLLLGGCVTPSIPLPPPDLQALSFSAGPTLGTLELTGKPTSVHVGATFTAFDEQHRAGVLIGTNPDGSFVTEPFAGAVGDQVELWFESNGQRSQLSTCTVTLGVALNNTICH
jgi:hypothetical protein